MPKYVTQEHFDVTFADFRREINEKFSDINGKFSDLTGLLDRYLKRTEDWRTELTVLRGRHNRLEDVLIRKHVVSDSELH